MTINPLRAFAKFAFAGIAAYAIGGCGSDEGGEGSRGHEEDGGNGGKGGDDSGGRGNGGSPSASAGGSVTSGGTTSVPPPRPAQCGGRTCGTAPLEALGLEVGACCPEGDGASTCGLDLSLLSLVGVELSEPCQAVAQPGTPSEECVDAVVDISGRAITLNGCCRPEGKCGTFANRIEATDFEAELGLGCIIADVFPPQLLMPGSCSPRQGGTGVDGGASDAGAGSDGGR